MEDRGGFDSVKEIVKKEEAKPSYRFLGPSTVMSVTSSGCSTSRRLKSMSSTKSSISFLPDQSSLSLSLYFNQ